MTTAGYSDTPLPKISASRTAAQWPPSPHRATSLICSHRSLMASGSGVTAAPVICRPKGTFDVLVANVAERTFRSSSVARAVAP